ncbi:hypothetical protein B2I21_07355 [Chryseobacterium mucoviscidosis]|nr:hypothetical protein B2I21_07355 [Chryseobacterium mucoviscidosis]
MVEMMHSLKQAADQLGISEVTMRRRIKDKKIKAYKDGGVWKIETEWIQEYKEALLEKSS